MEWLSELGPTAGAVAVVVLFLKFISDQAKAQNKRDETFAKSLESNTKAMREVANATKKSANEAEQRNGHLAELAIENQKANSEYQKAILDVIKTVNEQVKEQHIGKQIVDNQEIK